MASTTAPGDSLPKWSLVSEPRTCKAGSGAPEHGIPKERIGSSDHDHGLIGAAFNPFERHGGGVTHAGQVNLDSGRNA
jgi:hypothetical protein